MFLPCASEMTSCLTCTNDSISTSAAVDSGESKVTVFVLHFVDESDTLIDNFEKPLTFVSYGRHPVCLMVTSRRFNVGMCL